MNDAQRQAVISTTAGQYRIEPLGLSHFDVYDEAGRMLMLDIAPHRWRIGVFDLSINRRSAGILVAAVKRWIVTNRTCFHEMARRSLEEESRRARTEDLSIWVSVLRQIVRVLRVAGGTIDGHNLRHYERLLKMTATVDSLQRATA